MSFLYPLFLAGIAAVGLPIVLHLIRRHTRDRVTFSSLMFLRTTLPRFTSRSRLQNIPLLVLRCIMLCLLAFAFSRPFFSRPPPVGQVRPGRRMVLLIDTSASMRRGGMWAQAVSEARSVLEGVRPTDRVCVMSFDQSARALIGFEQWSELDPPRRASVAAEQIAGLSPGWDSTDLGQALVAAAEAIEDDEINEQQHVAGLRRVVLVSDLQQGSRLETLQGYEWPEGTGLVVKQITAEGTTNASLQLLTNRDDLAGSDGAVRPGVRITNSPDATAERFELSWAETDANEAEPITDVYVPPGRSAVVRIPARTDEPARRKLILTGDDHEFDNALYLAPYVRQQVNILYIGGDSPDDPREMLYYVRQCFGDSRALNPKMIFRPADGELADADVAAAHFIIAADVLPQQHINALRRYLESGRTALLVMKSPQASAAVAALAGIDNLQSEEAEVNGYAMLGRIEFDHPVLAPFSEPRFGDFTQIGFWKYRRLNVTDLPGARVLARFDSNDPALFELPVGGGSLLVLTSSWRPSDSQLALSSKFVPLLYSILEYGGVLVGQRQQHFVGNSVPMPDSPTSRPTNMKIRKPDDSLIDHDPGQEDFAQTDQPGIYTIESPAGNQLFAVNLPAAECRTAPMSIEDLEELGVSLEQSANVPVDLVKRASHHRKFAELESEQKLWRWALVALLAVALIESWLAGWLTGRPAAPGRE